MNIIHYRVERLDSDSRRATNVVQKWSEKQVETSSTD